MKSYTDLEQSKKLAEILPLESADMCWTNHCYGEIRSSMVVSSKTIEEYKELLTRFANLTDIDVFYSCWSLAALLDVLESEIDGEEGEIYQLKIEKDGVWWDVWYEEQHDDANPIETKSTVDLVDACYEMILKLHELKML